MDSTTKMWSTAELVDFGKYLLSEERNIRIRASKDYNPEITPFEIRVKEVHDADIANWQFQAQVSDISTDNDGLSI